MHSMTGYGRGLVQSEGREMTVELRSVNHRFLDVAYRGPRSLNFLEEEGRRLLSAQLSRGHVDISLQYRNTRQDARKVLFDSGLLAAYMSAFDEIGSSYVLSDSQCDLNLLARLPDVFTVVESPEDRDALVELFERCVSEALSTLVAMREAEGKRLRDDVLERICALEELTTQIAELAPTVVVAYRDKLVSRIGELTQGMEIDENRLAQEVAFMADRCAIDEELVRLKSHFTQIRAALESGDATGRKLDFLVQELNREANTIGSKSADIRITERVVQMKSEIEKVREQVQNVE